MGRKMKVNVTPHIKNKDVRTCKAGILLNRLTDKRSKSIYINTHAEN